MTTLKIQFFTPPFKKRGSNPNWSYPPLGVLYLASYVRKLYEGLEFKVTDAQLKGEEKSLEEFHAFQPDLVGVSFATPHAAAAYRFIDKLKEVAPGILVVCGGAHPSAAPDDVLARSGADIVVAGEGERAFAAIVSDFKEGRIKVGDKRTVIGSLIENLDDIPLPARDLVDISQYPGWFFRKRAPETHFLSSRGCPYNCFFCSDPVWKVKKPWVRFRSPQNVVDEIELLHKEYGINEFFDQCDEFNANVGHAMAICDEIIKRKLNISWKVQLTARSRNLPESLIARMAESGCWLVSLGLESGNQRTLDGIGKQITLEEIEYVCRLFKKYRIKIFGLFMVFNIWEENGKLVHEGVRESLNTIDFARTLRRKKLLDRLSCTITTPFPGSPLWDASIEHGLFNEEAAGDWDLWDSAFNQIIQLPGISKRDWQTVRVEGARLQSYVTFSGLRDVNLKNLPQYIGRLRSVLKLMLRM